MNEHRWSGWPQAWCLDCGKDDVRELCINTIHPSDIEFPIDENGFEIYDNCPIHQNGECPEPGSNRHNPYVKR
jgi:hypothetical protein